MFGSLITVLFYRSFINVSTKTCNLKKSKLITTKHRKISQVQLLIFPLFFETVPIVNFGLSAVHSVDLFTLEFDGEIVTIFEDS